MSSDGLNVIGTAVRYSYLATGNRLVIAAADPHAVIAALRH